MNEVYKAQVPSNIAFIKYWGKRPQAQQWPTNSSLSMTLDQLSTTTSARVIDAPDHRISLNDRVYHRDHRSMSKAFLHLDRMASLCATQAKLEIITHNSFPMGAGIASSASGLGALTLASVMCFKEARHWDELSHAGYSRHELAQLARLGSGSACRSFYDGYVAWNAGNSPENQHCTSVLASQRWPLRDTVVLFSSQEKAIGSTEAHAAAWSSPLFVPRLAALAERIRLVEKALDSQNIDELGLWLEVEALELHAVIMTAQPPQNYVTPAAFEFVSRLRLAREAGEVRAWFTIDAGPNIHLIHEAADHERLIAWLALHFPERQLLHDQVGQGPKIDFSK